MDELKPKIADTFKNFADLKTPACLDAKALGLFAENRLADDEAAKAESHIQSCLHCLDQLTEMKELLHLAAEVEPVSPELDKKLSALFARQKK